MFTWYAKVFMTVEASLWFHLFLAAVRPPGMFQHKTARCSSLQGCVLCKPTIHSSSVCWCWWGWGAVYVWLEGPVHIPTVILIYSPEVCRIVFISLVWNSPAYIIQLLVQENQGPIKIWWIVHLFQSTANCFFHYWGWHPPFGMQYSGFFFKQTQ